MPAILYRKTFLTILQQLCSFIQNRHNKLTDMHIAAELRNLIIEILHSLDWVWIHIWRDSVDIISVDICVMFFFFSCFRTITPPDKAELPKHRGVSSYQHTKGCVLCSTLCCFSCSCTLTYYCCLFLLPVKCLNFQTDKKPTHLRMSSQLIWVGINCLRRSPTTPLARPGQNVPM